MRRLRNSVLKAALVMAPLSLFGQVVPQIKLKAADAKLDEEFTALGSVRELSDGRVLLNDARDKRIVVADFKTGAVAQVGRLGSGPNEYAAAAPLHIWPATRARCSTTVRGAGCCSVVRRL